MVAIEWGEKRERERRFLVKCAGFFPGVVCACGKHPLIGTTSTKKKRGKMRVNERKGQTYIRKRDDTLTTTTTTSLTSAGDGKIARTREKEIE